MNGVVVAVLLADALGAAEAAVPVLTDSVLTVVVLADALGAGVALALLVVFLSSVLKAASAVFSPFGAEMFAALALQINTPTSATAPRMRNAKLTRYPMSALSPPV
jgi:hypothetical protein